MNSIPCALGFAVCVPGTIDRFEGDFAVVEWPSGLLGDVPVARLPAASCEGDRVVLAARPGWRGEAMVLGTFPPALVTPWGLLVLPSKTSVHPGRPYVVRFRIPPRVLVTHSPQPNRMQ